MLVSSASWSRRRLLRLTGRGEASGNSISQRPPGRRINCFARRRGSMFRKPVDARLPPLR